MRIAPAFAEAASRRQGIDFARHAGQGIRLRKNEGRVLAVRG
ncbi:MAG: hypothetical protein H6Q41_910 [Deltaproteobacteria bacterium]|nr:hypothetical protein [Deltaproteobacteria bacterium]